MHLVSDYTDHSASCFFSINIIFLRSHIDMYLGLGKFPYCCAEFDHTNIPQFTFQYPFLVIVRNNAVIIFFLHAEHFFRLCLQLEFLDHGARTCFFNYAMHPSFPPKILMVTFSLLLLWLYRESLF